jgi:hypothetical protein
MSGFLFLSLGYTLSLSEYCKGQSKLVSAEISNFDIPFQECRENPDFTNVVLTANETALKDYKFRTLRVANNLTLKINGVSSGKLLRVLDVADGTLELDMGKANFGISGNVRINTSMGAKLILNGSLSLRPQKILRVVHTNDIHCHLMDDGRTIPFSRYMTFVKEERARGLAEDYMVLVVDAGDFTQGLPLTMSIPTR